MKTFEQYCTNRAWLLLLFLFLVIISASVLSTLFTIWLEKIL